MEEQWKPITGYPGYEVSNMGRVKALQKTVKKWNGMRTVRERILKPLPTHDGYLRVGLYMDGKRQHLFIHHLVLEEFVSKSPPDHQCNHKDGVKKNNFPTNLEWVTLPDNRLHAVKNGLYARGEEVYGAKLHAGEVWLIKRLLALSCLKQRTIAKMFKVNEHVISRIKKGRTWTHVDQ